MRTPFERTPTTCKFTNLLLVKNYRIADFYVIIDYINFFAANGNALKTLLSKILANQNEIMEQLSIVKRDVKGIKEEIEKKKQETSEPIQIPNRIRVSSCTFAALIALLLRQINVFITYIKTRMYCTCST